MQCPRCLLLVGNAGVASWHKFLVSRVRRRIGADDSHIFVNKSFVFKECDDARLRILLHQSSLPYQPGQ